MRNGTSTPSPVWSDEPSGPRQSIEENRTRPRPPCRVQRPNRHAPPHPSPSFGIATPQARQGHAKPLTFSFRGPSCRSSLWFGCRCTSNVLPGTLEYGMLETAGWCHAQLTFMNFGKGRFSPAGIGCDPKCLPRLGACLHVACGVDRVREEAPLNRVSL